MQNRRGKYAIKIAALMALAGIEIPLKMREPWALGVFYSERFSPESDFDLSGRTLKLQGAITL